MQEISLKSVCLLLIARLRWIVFAAAAGLLLFGSYAYFFVSPQYTSSVLVYVRNMAEGEKTSSVTSSNLTASRVLATTYAVALKTDRVLDEASQRLGGSMSRSQLAQAVSVSAVEDTSFLRVSVTASTPALAEQACGVLAEVSADAFQSIGEVGSARVADNVKAAGKTAPNVLRTAVIGALLGLVLSAALVILTAMMNTAVQDKESLRERVDVPVLGEIPSFDLTLKKKRKGGRRHHA